MFREIGRALREWRVRQPVGRRSRDGGRTGASPASAGGIVGAGEYSPPYDGQPSVLETWPRLPCYRSPCSRAGGVSRVRTVLGWTHGSSVAKTYPVQFSFVAPGAQNVSLVGSFNGWNANHAQYRAHPKGGGLWTLTVPLPSGLHRFAFVVTDSGGAGHPRWVTDPNAPTAPGSEVGYSNSAIVIGADGQ